MLAASAMNGAILDSTFGIFFKLRYDKVYDGVLATPMRTVDIARGELAWSLLRSADLLRRLPAGDGRDGAGVVVVGGAGLAGDLADRVRVRRRRDGADDVHGTPGRTSSTSQLAIVPMFLFSATFFPVTAFDGALRWVVEATPLYRGVTLTRELTTGAVTVDSLSRCSTSSRWARSG